MRDSEGRRCHAVGVAHEAQVTSRGEHAASDGKSLASIGPIVQKTHPLAIEKRLRTRRRLVGAGVVDNDDLPLAASFLEESRGSRQNAGDLLLLIENWDDD